jgi:hypothetical protein
VRPSGTHKSQSRPRFKQIFAVRTPVSRETQLSPRLRAGPSAHQDALSEERVNDWPTPPWTAIVMPYPMAPCGPAARSLVVMVQRNARAWKSACGTAHEGSVRGLSHAMACGQRQRPSATRTEAAVIAAILCQSMAGCATSAGIAIETISAATPRWNDAERLLPQLTDLRKRISSSPADGTFAGSGHRCRDRLENAASKATLVLVRTLCRTAAF